jgi:divalent metal cation (Fe/Co/Zn/Cd) transporter
MVDRASALLRRGLALEYTTLAWNVVGIVVLAVAAIAARSVALAGFGLDSLIEIFASVVVVWELKGASSEAQERRALRLVAGAFVALAVYLTAQAVYVLTAAAKPHTSPLGIGWTAMTCAVMLGLARGKALTGKALDNPVLQTEGKVTLVDAYLAGAVLAGLVVRAAFGWWWADPLAGFVIVFYAVKEARVAWAGE